MTDPALPCEDEDNEPAVVLSAHDEAMRGRKGMWIRFGVQGGGWWDLFDEGEEFVLATRGEVLDALGIVPAEDTWFWVTAEEA